MFFVQAWLRWVSHEKLGAISVGPRISTRDKARLRVSNPRTLIREATAIDTLVSRSVCVNYVPTLHHKSRNDPVDSPRLVMQILTFFPSAQSSEILCGFRQQFRKELNHYSLWFLVAILQIQPALLIFFRSSVRQVTKPFLKLSPSFLAVQIVLKTKVKLFRFPLFHLCLDLVEQLPQ